ncbi:MAG TPA: glycosyltransferase family A protein [Myxococcota bacterium]
MDVSICIASGRRDGLVRLLESVARLKQPPGLAFEVVIVHDAARPGAADSLPDPGVPVRRFHETRANLSHARNRSVEEARGRWLAFVDDDEVVCEDWLAAYWAMSEARDCDGFFGPVLPHLEPLAGAWIDARFFERERFASGTPIRGRGARTGNAFVRRNLFEACAFDPAYGRRGGEDWDLFRRMQARGRQFLWCDEARVEEFVPAERQRAGWLARRAFRGGAAYARIEARTAAARRRERLRSAAALLAALAGLPAAALLGRRAALRCALRLCVQAGKLRALSGRCAAQEAS